MNQQNLINEQNGRFLENQQRYIDMKRNVFVKYTDHKNKSVQSSQNNVNNKINNTNTTDVNDNSQNYVQQLYTLANEFQQRQKTDIPFSSNIPQSQNNLKANSQNLPINYTQLKNNIIKQQFKKSIGGSVGGGGGGGSNGQNLQTLARENFQQSSTKYDVLEANKINPNENLDIIAQRLNEIALNLQTVNSSQTQSTKSKQRTSHSNYQSHSRETSASSIQQLQQPQQQQQQLSPMQQVYLQHELLLYQQQQQQGPQQNTEYSPVMAKSPDKQSSSKSPSNSKGQIQSQGAIPANLEVSHKIFNSQQKLMQLQQQQRIPFKSVPEQSQFTNLQSNNYALNLLDNKQFNGLNDVTKVSPLNNNSPSLQRKSPKPQSKQQQKSSRSHKSDQYQLTITPEGNQPTSNICSNKLNLKPSFTKGLQLPLQLQQQFQEQLQQQHSFQQQQKQQWQQQLQHKTQSSSQFQTVANIINPENEKQSPSQQQQLQQYVSCVNLGTHSSQLRNLQFQKQNQYFQQNKKKVSEKQFPRLNTDLKQLDTQIRELVEEKQSYASIKQQQKLSIAIMSSQNSPTIMNQNFLNGLCKTERQHHNKSANNISNFNSIKQFNSNSNVKIQELENEIYEVKNLQKIHQETEQNIENFNTQSIEQELQMLNNKLNLYKSEKHKVHPKSHQNSAQYSTQYQSLNSLLNPKNLGVQPKMQNNNNEELSNNIAQNYHSVHEPSLQVKQNQVQQLCSQKKSSGTKHVKILEEYNSVHNFPSIPDTQSLTNKSSQQPNTAKLEKQLKFVKQFVGHRHSVNCICYDINSMIMFSGSSDYTISTWDIRDKKNNKQNSAQCVQQSNQKNPQSCLKQQFEKDLDQVQGSDSNRSNGINNSNWKQQPQSYSQEYTNSVRAHRRWVQSICCHKNLLISGGADQIIKLWQIQPEQSQQIQNIVSLKGHGGPITSIQGLNIHQFISGSVDRSIICWDIPKQKQFLKYSKIHEKQINELIDFNQNFFACCSSDGFVKLFDSRQEKSIDQLNAHKFGTESMDISENYENGSLITVGLDGYIRMWDIRKMELYKEVKCEEEQRREVVELEVVRIFEENNKSILAVLSTGKELRIVDLMSGNLINFEYRFNAQDFFQPIPYSSGLLQQQQQFSIGKINDIFVDSNSKSFYAASSNQTITQWNYAQIIKLYQ